MKTIKSVLPAWYKGETKYECDNKENNLVF